MSNAERGVPRTRPALGVGALSAESVARSIVGIVWVEGTVPGAQSILAKGGDPNRSPPTKAGGMGGRSPPPASVVREGQRLGATRRPPALES